jgi:D-glycero-D-manno-heptose 1,7-bisphosphate phosphatase
MVEKGVLAPIVTDLGSTFTGSILRYVGLDRDNTLIEDAGYTNLDQDPKWLPGVIDGLKLLHAFGFGLVIFTNQAALSKGVFNLVELEDFHNRLNLSLLAQTGFGFSGIIICPHLQEQSCTCRKPRPGMFFAAQKIYGDLPQVMFGDSDTDIQASKSAGVLAIKTHQVDFLEASSEWLKI